MKREIREIGHFETGRNIVTVIDSDEVRLKVGALMPLPGKEIEDDVKAVAEWLINLGKTEYMFFSPEIAIIEKMIPCAKGQEVIIIMPCDMEEEIGERLKNNLPRGMKVSLLEEPYFPKGFFPGNGVIVVCGYMAGERLMVLPETYRLIDHYSGFMGKKVFVPYTHLNEAVRYKGWIEVSADRFSEVWRRE